MAIRERRVTTPTTNASRVSDKREKSPLTKWAQNSSEEIPTLTSKMRMS
jgi:hypothetical protein